MNENPGKTRGAVRQLAAVCLALAFLLGSGGGSSAAALPAGALREMPRQLVPVGRAVGLKLFSDGVLVVGLSDLETSGGTAAPAKEGGLKVGDFILEADDVAVESTEHFQSIVAAATGEETSLTIKRDGRTMELAVSAVQCTDGAYRLGAWVRDSLAGIGTMTFYDPESGVFGTLGHGINDVDTGQLMRLDVGAIMEAAVKGVRKGESGTPGELRGDFNLTEDLGTLFANTANGVFGTMEQNVFGGEPVEVASASQVHTGGAEILANVEGETVKSYDIEITRICNPGSSSQNFLIRVTDPDLLEVTGGIVQGMSGSPILQDGKFIGAVTHVMVDEPTCGYGIFLENMLSAAGWT